MARKITWGTPGRSERYLFPREKFRFLYPALALSGLILAVLVAAQLSPWRRAVSPGSVISQHTPLESRCQECHTTGKGISNLRCQRCHDPAGGGRLTNAAHVLFGSRDPRKAAAAPDLSCAGCHVEHRGRRARLAAVDETHCAQCHFRSLRGHPEFAVLRSKSREVPGLKFTHERHVKEAIKKWGGTVKDACLRCHEPTPGGRDIDPVSFDRHCATCHLKDGSVGPIDPMTQEDALAPQAIVAQGVQGDWLQRTGEYEIARGKVAKTSVRHRDEWVLYNLSRLRRELDPEGYAAERGALLARLSQLRRRLALAQSLAELDLTALKARQAAIESELKGVQARLEAQPRSATVPGAGLDRLDELIEAAGASGDAQALSEARQLRAAADPLRAASLAPAALPADEYEARRKELLALLEAIEGADPSLRPRAEDLRRRLLALTPGENGTELLARVREQRSTDLERVKDELRLRQSGLMPASAVLLAVPQRAILEAMRKTQARLDEISKGPPPAASLAEEVAQRKKESADVLSGPCVKCHLVQRANLARVVAARPVMSRARFAHQPHLLVADCGRCHPGVEKSKLSQDLNFRGVESCRECHGSRRVRADCQACHVYHAPVVP